MTSSRRLTFPIALLLLLAALPAARAQSASPAELPGIPIPTAGVDVDGVVLFRVRGVAAFTAQMRAAHRANLVVEAARDPEVDPDKLEIVDAQNALEITGAERSFGAIFEADGRLEGLTAHELALVQRKAIQLAIVRYREARTPRRLGTAGAQAVAATAVFGVLIALLLPLFRRIDRFVERRWKRQAEDLEARSFRLLRAGRLRALVRGSLRTLRATLLVGLAYVYLSNTLVLFPWTRFVAVRLDSWVLTPLQTMGRMMVAEIPNLIFLLILVAVVRYGLKLVRLFFDNVARGSVTIEGFEAEWAWPTYRIVRLVAIAFAVVAAYPYIPGSGSEAFRGVSIFTGLVFSLGSTSAISNIVAGYTMAYRRAFRVGDRVKIGDVVGDVTDVRMAVTTVRTPKNEEVVIPNATILNGEIVNYSTLATTRGLILHTTVGIGYEVPWRQVEALLLMAAERTPGLPKEPTPFVLQRALADCAVKYELNVYCEDARQMHPLYTALHRHIQDVFNEHAVQIMTPAYVADTPDAKIVPKDRWYAAPAAPSSGEAGGLPAPL